MAFVRVAASALHRTPVPFPAVCPRSQFNCTLPRTPCMVVNRADEQRAAVVDAQLARPAPRNYGAFTSRQTAHHTPAPAPAPAPAPRTDSHTPPAQPPTARVDTPDDTHHTHDTDGAPVDRRLIFGAVLLLAGLAVGGLAAANGLLDADRLVMLSQWFESLGPEAGLLYAAVYFLLELIGVPALPLTMGSGYLFGVAKGTLCVSVASTAAAAAAFLIARYGLRSSVARLAARYPRFRAMDRAIGREGFRFVFLLRLSPLLPFSISNYLYGLTSVDLSAYVLGSWLGMLPGTIAYVSAGAAVGALTDLSAGKGSVNPVLLVIGLVATVAALSTIGKIATDAIEAEGDEEIAEQR